MSSSSSPPSTGASNAPVSLQGPSSSSNTRKRKAPRRRGGDEPLAQLVDLTEIKKRRKTTTRQRYNKAYARRCVNSAKEIIEWLVTVEKTGNLLQGVTEGPNHEYWWFDWQKKTLSAIMYVTFAILKDAN